MRFILHLNFINRAILNFIKIQIFCALFLITSLLYAQTEKLDSLKRVINKMPGDTVKVDALIDLSKTLMSSSLDETIRYAVLARDLADSLNYRSGKAWALKNIGLGFYHQSDFLNVFEFWEQSLEIFKEIGEQRGIANLESNLGSVYFNQGDDAKAIEYFLRSLTAAEAIDDSLGMGRALIGIGIVYQNKESTYNKAKEYNQQALSIFEQLNYGNGIATCAVNLGDIYLDQSQYDSALYYLEISIGAFENEVFVPHSLTLIGQTYSEMGDYQKAMEYLEQAIAQAEQLNLKMEMAQALVGLAKTLEFQGNPEQALKTYQEAEQISLEIGGNYELKDAYQGMAQMSAEIGKYGDAFNYFQRYDAVKDTLYNLETDDKIKGLQFTYQIDKKQTEVDLLTKEKSIQQLEIKRQQQAKYSYLAGALFLLLIAFITYRNYRRKVKTNQLLDDQNEEIEKLILNILPAETAKELQNDGYATPRYYESVSVLFTDFKDFTKIAEGLKPHELIAELNSFFNAFDDIIEHFHLEKIKTIGDSYMCAGGLPVANKTHPRRIVKAGLAMQKLMADKNKQRMKLGGQPWELRIGIHTGSIVAGVVGKKKYAYDIWGDTVNIASRMESNGEVGKVNVSAATYELVKDDFTCTYRGKIGAKNKGYIDMYFLEEENTEKLVTH